MCLSRWSYSARTHAATHLLKYNESDIRYVFLFVLKSKVIYHHRHNHLYTVRARRLVARVSRAQSGDECTHTSHPVQRPGTRGGGGGGGGGRSSRGVRLPGTRPRGGATAACGARRGGRAGPRGAPGRVTALVTGCPRGDAGKMNKLAGSSQPVLINVSYKPLPRATRPGFLPETTPRCVARTRACHELPAWSAKGAILVLARSASHRTSSS